jgi:hypothetical protein
VEADGGFFLQGFSGANFDTVLFWQNTRPYDAQYEEVQWPLSKPPPPPTPLEDSVACAPNAWSELDLLTSGDALITRDNVSKLEWLDLTETLGLTYAEVSDPSGPWAAGAWRYASKREVCELFEHAGITAETDCQLLDGSTSFAAAANGFPARFDGLLSKLGATSQTAPFPAVLDTQSAQAAGPPPAVKPPFWYPITAGYSCGGFSCDPVLDWVTGQIDTGNNFGAAGWSFGSCGPDAETGWCATEGLYDSGGAPHVASLSRGLAKCSDADTRTCMDGMIHGESTGDSSACKKCGILNDLDFCGVPGCSEDQAFPNVGSFLVRLPEPNTTTGLVAGILELAGLTRRRPRHVV